MKIYYIGENSNIRYFETLFNITIHTLKKWQDLEISGKERYLFLKEALFKGKTKIEDEFRHFQQSYPKEVQALMALSVLHVNDFGGINEMLKISKMNDASFADGLHRWQRSMITLGKKVPQSFYNKLWLQVYCELDCKGEIMFDINHSCFLGLKDKLINKN